MKRCSICNYVYQLIGEEEHSLETELPVAEVEQVLQRRTEEINHHGIVVALCAKPANERHANASRQGFVNLGLIL